MALLLLEDLIEMTPVMAIETAKIMAIARCRFTKNIWGDVYICRPRETWIRVINSAIVDAILNPISFLLNELYVR